VEREYFDVNLSYYLSQSSSAKCIAYLNAGVIFTGSETGDSHLIQMDSTGDINIVDTFQSIAPVSDAVLADLDNSGDPVIVTCSGGGRTGSLRIVRTGASIEELGSITGVNGIRDVFPLTNTDGYVFHPLKRDLG
jgi:DNA damage-binding protein 1